MKTIDRLNLLSRDEIIEITLSLAESCEYTLNNLDAAARDKLITCPAWFQVHLGEARKIMRASLNKMEG